MNTTTAQTPSGRIRTGGTNTSGGASKNNGSQGGKFMSDYRNKVERSIITVNQADKDFKGKEDKIGVLGLPIEKNLKSRLSYEESRVSHTTCGRKSHEGKLSEASDQVSD